MSEYFPTMGRFKIEITARSEDGTTVNSTIEKEGESKQDVEESYLEAIDHVDYWDISIDRIEQIQ